MVCAKEHYHPKDKAKAEVGVQVVERWILARLRHQTFFSLVELNSAIAKLLEALNDKPFKKLPGTRRSAYELLDKPALKALPSINYEYRLIKKAQVKLDYHIEVAEHHYSVPHQYIGQCVEYQLGEHDVSIFCQGKRIAYHERSHAVGESSTLAEHDVLMPAPITYAHRLVRQQVKCRESGKLSWLRPDAKSQVTFIYDGFTPVGIDLVVLSTQHEPGISQSDLVEVVREEIIKPVLPAEWLNDATKYLINPTGQFVIGGPMGDCGLTGRKIIVDTYGGIARHDGGAFSGKDPSKVDRSAAYMARFLAKNIVAAGLAKRCEIQLAYAIGVAEPTAVYVDTFGTGIVADQEIEQLILNKVDLTPKGIIERLQLKQPRYLATAAFGHFGREEDSFTWEQVDAGLLK